MFNSTGDGFGDAAVATAGLGAGAFLAAAPFIALAGSIEGKHAEKKWQPYFDHLSGELAKHDISSDFLRELQHQLPRGGLTFVSGNADSAEGSVLTAELRRITLREHPKSNGLFGLEIAARFRLTEKKTRGLPLRQDPLLHRPGETDVAAL